MVRATIYILLLLMLVTFLAACVLHAKPNTKWYLKDNIKFSAKLYLDDSKIYNRLEIGTPKQSFSQHTPLFVFLINGKIMRSDDINIPLFKKLSTGTSNPNQFGGKWPSESELYFFSGYSVLVYKGEVLAFYVGTKGSPQPMPKIGAISSEKLYTMPLKLEEVVEIFGEEDELIEFFMQ